MKKGLTTNHNEIHIDNQEIVIQQQLQNIYNSTNTANDFIEEQLQNNNDQQHNNTNKLNNQTITINKNKLLSYVLTEHNPNISPNTTHKYPKQFSIRNAQKKYQINTNTLNKQNSIKTLKLISHKIGHHHQRIESKLKTESDKQNQIELILSNLKKQVETQNNELNKNSSAIILKKQKQKIDPFAPFSPHLKESNPNINKKNETIKSCMKSFSLTKIRPSRFSTIENTEFNDSDHISKIMHEVQYKQGNVQEQRTQLQKKSQLLHDQIEREKTRLEDISNSSKKLTSALQKQQTLLKSHSLQVTLYKRKIQNYQQQITVMENNVEEATYCNSKLLNNIHEEKQLINMYEAVIDELKDQIKLQKHEKGDLLKKLTILKKNEKSTVSKLTTQEINTNEIFRKIYLSLEKWK